jgi:hypothetical protein
MFREALAIRRASAGTNQTLILDSLKDVGRVLVKQAKPADAEPLLQEAVTLSKAIYGTEHLEVASSLIELSSAFKDDGKPAQAEAALRELLPLQEKLLGPRAREVTITRGNLVWTLEQQEKRDEAEPLLLEAYETLQTDPKAGFQDKHDAIERLWRFYLGWAAAAPNTGKTQKALEWKAKLTALGDTPRDLEPKATGANP